MLRASPVGAENFRESHCLARSICQANSLFVMSRIISRHSPLVKACQAIDLSVDGVPLYWQEDEAEPGMGLMHH